MFRGFLLAGLIALAPSAALAQQACNTSDARKVVDELYRHMLERTADTGSQGWVDQLQSGRVTVRDVVRQIAESPESTQRFYNAKEGANAYANAVGNLYRHVLGREPDAAGTASYASMASRAGGLTPVVDQLVNSAEYSKDFGDWGVPGSGGLVYCSNATTARTPSQQITPSARGNQPYQGNQPTQGNQPYQGNGSYRDNGSSRGNGQYRDNGSYQGNRSYQATGRYDDYNMRPSDRFGYLDVNHDRYIEQNEWDGSLQMFYQLDRNNDGRLSSAELNESGTMTSFQSIDANRDGRIELGEWRWSHASFDQMDRNGDGVITRDEFNSGAVSTSGRRY